ncbi:MAG: hypothetical protein ACK40G_17500 [Cytophagaceae bacterium]
MKNCNIQKLPQKDEDLQIWLECFISQLHSSSLIYNLDEKESQFLVESSKIVINNITRKKMGMDMDHVSAEIIKKETLGRIGNLLQQC